MHACFIFGFATRLIILKLISVCFSLTLDSCRLHVCLSIQKYDIVCRLLSDTFASKVAAANDPYADSSVGNVTGSNAVNVFLGIGIAWTMAAIKHAIYGTRFIVEPGSLGYSVCVFCAAAVVAIVIMIARRHKSIGGELGGPRRIKIVTSIVLLGLWIIYIILSSLETYCHIKGF